MADDKCCTFVLGTKIFAIINLVIVSLSALSLWGFAVYFGMVLYHYGAEGTGMIVLIFVPLILGPLLAILFGILLLVGVLKEKPNWLIAYIVYGILTIILTVIGASLVTYGNKTCFEDLCYNTAALAGTILVCVIYAVILCMIGMAQYQLRKGRYQGFKCISPECPTQPQN